MRKHGDEGKLLVLDDNSDDVVVGVDVGCCCCCLGTTTTSELCSTFSWHKIMYKSLDAMEVCVGCV